MYKTLAVIAALMATPVMADFQKFDFPIYCTKDYADMEKTFGDFDNIDVSKPNKTEAAAFYMENERYEINGIIHISGMICVTWVNDRGEAG